MSENDCKLSFLKCGEVKVYDFWRLSFEDFPVLGNFGLSKFLTARTSSGISRFGSKSSSSSSSNESESSSDSDSRLLSVILLSFTES